MGKAIDDEVLLALAKKGGGGGGTDDYEILSHKPQVNGHTLEGNKTTSDLGIKFEDLPDAPTIPSQLYAGDYIEIDENNKINVKMQKGDLTEYQYKLHNNTSAVTLTIEKYIEGILVESNTYQNTTLYTPLVVDDRLQVSYSPSWPDRYCWIYTLLTDSKEHAKDDRFVWYYTTEETHIETFDVEDDVATLIRKGDLDYANLPNKPSINGVTLSGNKTTSDLSIDKTAVGLGNVPNVSTNDQTPTFTEAGTRNNIASGEKLSVILGKVQKFFNDLKTVAFSGSYTDLTNQPKINGNTLSGNKTTSDLGINADNVMMSDGVTSVEERISVSSLDNRTAITGDFVASSDGYIYAVASLAGDYVSCRIYGSNTLPDNVVLIGVGFQSGMGANAVYVKKGMRISHVSLVAGGKLWFVPFM